MQSDPNRETDRLFAYHEKTKHSYWSVRSGGHFLDWDNQPDPFRRFAGAPRLPLSKGPLPDCPAFDALLGGTGLAVKAAQGGAVDAAVLGQLLHHSMAVSAWKQVRGTDIRYSLRVNPSSGNLHPTETYLAVQGSADLPDGLYHYDVRGHSLERRREGPAVEAAASLLGRPWAAESPFLVLLSSVFWREAWKYRDRAYRYCLLDLGHAAASILIAARCLGFEGLCLGHFPDRPLAEFLGVDPLDEGPLMALAFEAGPSPSSRPTPDPASIQEDPQKMGPLLGEANRLSAEELPYYLLKGMHQSTLLPPESPLPAVPSSGPAPDTGLVLPGKPSGEPPLGPTARRRRSGLDFDPRASMTLQDLGWLLLRAVAPLRADYRGNLRGGPGEGLVRLYLYAHRVEGLPAGVYRYHPSIHRLQTIREGDQRATAAYLSLEQELAGHACAAFSMVADLNQAARLFGNRGYRYVHFEAGMIGQRLYLGAEALGLNSTGMGAFYDDEVHRYLDIKPEEGQVVYHFAVGRAVPDERLIPLGEDMENDSAQDFQ